MSDKNPISFDTFLTRQQDDPLQTKLINKLSGELLKKLMKYRRVAAFDVKVGERTDRFAEAWRGDDGQYYYYPEGTDPNVDHILQPIKFYECDHLGFRLPNQSEPKKLTPF